MPNIVASPNAELAAENEIQVPPPPPPKPLPPESIRWRIIRWAVAAPMFAVSILALFPFSIVPVSSQAVVNARLSRVRAPIEGELGNVVLESGDAVSAGQPLTSVRRPSTLLQTEATADLRALGDLQRDSDRLGAELSAGEAEKSRYDQMFSQYTGHRSDDLQAQVRDAQADIAMSETRVQSAQAEVKRDQQALADHLIPRTTLDAAQEKVETAQRDVAAKQAAVRRLQKQATDARTGYSDTGTEPSFVSARNTAATQVDRLRAEKDALDQRIARMQGGQGSVAAAANTSTAAGQFPPQPVDSPVSGFIWSRTVATGQAVRQGDDMFRIADANSIHVEVWLDRRYGPQLSIGDDALVYLGGLGQELRGRVISFEGTSRRVSEEDINAIDLQAVHPDQYHVTIELSPTERKAQYIGQAAKVLFPGSKHPLRARLYFWLTRL